LRTAPAVDGRYCALPEYPPASRQFEEAGTVVLNFLIDVDGRVLQSRIESSSGHPRLDEAALRALSLCRFKPGTVDGKPDRSWHKMKYVWKLEE
jgi:protein TonB